MADTALSAPNPYLAAVLALMPSVGQCLVLIVTCAVGVVGTLATQRLAKKPEPIFAAERPAPMALAAVDDVMRVQCGDVKGKLDEILVRLPAPKGVKR